MTQLEIEIKNRYGISRGDDTQETSGIDMQRASDFIEGYHQAEKDLEMMSFQTTPSQTGLEEAEKDNELTWEDMFDIFRLVNEVLDDYAEGKTKKEVGEEILRRFKERKEK